MTLFTFSDALWVFTGLAAFWFYGLIGAWIGYLRRETFYTHCDKKDEGMLPCYLITALLWPLRFPCDDMRTRK